MPSGADGSVSGVDGILKRVRAHVEASGVEAALERARAGMEALAETAAQLEARLPTDVGAAVRDGLRAEALPGGRAGHAGSDTGDALVTKSHKVGRAPATAAASAGGPDVSARRPASRHGSRRVARSSSGARCLTPRCTL